MRRLAFLLSLLAALAGTPLRQAEAADDLARSLSELSQPADLEAPDGGVGDDSGVGTLTASHVHSSEIVADLAPFVLPLSAGPIAMPALKEAVHERPWWPESPPTLRFAWLQTFRF